MLAPDTLIQNRYRVVSCIGQGGMGAVYAATDTHLHKAVALKQLLIAGPQAVKAFQREALLLARLTHPDLPRVIDYFSHAGGYFLVMEFVPGPDLAEMLEQRGTPFPVAQVLEWAGQMLDLLEYLHTQKPPVLHRDIKPHNIKLTPDGCVMLLDFGLAKELSTLATPATRSKSSSIIAYTPQYAPLELIQRTGIDPRSDLYSLAATLHTLLTGEPPVDAMSRAAAIINGNPDPQQPPHTRNPQIPTSVSEVIMQALAMRADERPASATTLRSALHATQQQIKPIAYTGDTIVVDGAGREIEPAKDDIIASPANVTTIGEPAEDNIIARRANAITMAFLLVGTLTVLLARWVPGVFVVLFLSAAVRVYLAGKKSQAGLLAWVAVLLVVLPFAIPVLLPLIPIAARVALVVGIIIIVHELLKR